MVSPKSVHELQMFHPTCVTVDVRKAIFNTPGPIKDKARLRRLGAELTHIENLLRRARTAGDEG